MDKADGWKKADSDQTKDSNNSKSNSEDYT